MKRDPFRGGGVAGRGSGSEGGGLRKQGPLILDDSTLKGTEVYWQLNDARFE